MPLAVVSMLQQQKCLETLDEQQQQKNQATAVAEVGSTQRQYAETRLINAAFDATCKQEQRTAWQHVTATKQQSQQQVSSEKSLRDTTNLHNVGITDKCMLNAAARQQTHVASNITHTTNRNVATLVEHTEANVALEKVLNKSKQQTETLHVANSIGNKVLSNMLPQHTTLARLKTKRARHQSVAAVQSAEKRAKIANAKAKATKLNTTTIITTTTNQSTQSAAMCEIAAPTGEPSVKQQRQHQHHNTEKTIDFNSRRRRGRLRAANVHNAVCGNGLTASVCRALMWLARYLEKVAHNRASAGYDQSDPLLYLLSVLLSLIVVNVNRVASLVNEYKCEVNRNALANTNNKANTNNTTNTTNTPNTNSAKNNKNLQIITNQTIELVSESTVDAGSAAELLQLPEIGDVNEELEEDKTSVDALESESESEQVAKAENNNKINAQNTVMTLDRNALALTERAGLMTARSATKRGKSNCAANAHASATTTTKPTAGGTSKTFVAMQMQLLFYAFILCTSILLPSGNNLVAAAKPKSATQLQQQKLLQQQQLLLQQQQQQQQQYEHQHGHQAHQPAAGPNGGFGTLGGYASAGIPVASGGTAGADLTPPTYQVVSSRASNEQAEFIFPAEQSDEQVFDQENLNVVELDDDDDDEEEAGLKKTYGLHDNETAHANVTKAPLFPKDLFTKEQLENGAVICHIIGVIYMFVALAIVCDEFFVPSLDVIIEKLDITDDVAGATFMAAGGSAPELFTSVIGVFISFDDVGIGTIVGSAVFNILFVIGMCALFSKTILALTWWPLFRDCSFYSISLLVLIYFFRDNFIYWWEALILFSIYIAYVTFMKWNVQVERFVKRLITKNKGNAANSSETSMATQPGGSVTSRAASETRSGPPGSSSGAGATGNSSGTAGSTHTGAKFRHGLLQLMIHTIDPLHDGKVDEKATQLHAIASLKVLLDATKPQRGGATTSAANHVKINLKETTLADRPNGNIDTTLDSPSIQSQSGRRPSWIDQRVKIQTRKFSIKANEIEDEPEPLSMAWPDTARKRLTYIMVAPLLIPMWLTLPDTRTPRGKKYYPVTFIGSILWIAAFSYLMVWWANVAGDTARIPPEVMGLTFLAAGTSIPDLITSVIVARKGFGDMAVSSSVGSNIFDVTVGLPIPWLIYGIIYDAPVEVNSVGMVCSITILFMMLLFVVMSIACFRWKMNRGLGFTMFLLYFVFVAVSLMFEYDTLQCPV